MEITAGENPDDPNCQPVANTGLAFPGCCPSLSCVTASPLTTISPTGNLLNEIYYTVYLTCRSNVCA